MATVWRIGWRPLIAALLLALLVGACSVSATLSMLHWMAHG